MCSWAFVVIVVYVFDQRWCGNDSVPVCSVMVLPPHGSGLAPSPSGLVATTRSMTTGPTGAVPFTSALTVPCRLPRMVARSSSRMSGARWGLKCFLFQWRLRLLEGCCRRLLAWSWIQLQFAILLLTKCSRQRQALSRRQAETVASA